jgi:hypothetical protein
MMSCLSLLLELLSYVFTSSRLIVDYGNSLEIDLDKQKVLDYCTYSVRKLVFTAKCLIEQHFIDTTMTASKVSLVTAFL